VLEALFVYGTLCPGHPNEHILANIGGTFEQGSVVGNLIKEGWGAKMGFPALVLDETGQEINGYVFSSTNLKDHWHVLDEFEGDAYSRILTQIKLLNGEYVQANVYALNVK